MPKSIIPSIKTLTVGSSKFRTSEKQPAKQNPRGALWPAPGRLSPPGRPAEAGRSDGECASQGSSAKDEMLNQVVRVGWYGARGCFRSAKDEDILSEWGTGQGYADSNRSDVTGVPNGLSQSVQYPDSLEDCRLLGMFFASVCGRTQFLCILSGKFLTTCLRKQTNPKSPLIPHLKIDRSSAVTQWLLCTTVYRCCLA